MFFVPTKQSDLYLSEKCEEFCSDFPEQIINGIHNFRIGPIKWNKVATELLSACVATTFHKIGNWCTQPI